MSKHESPFPPRPEKQLPFPHKSLPQAGESLRETALDLFLDKFVFYVALATGCGVIAFVEWWNRWTGHPISPWVWTVLAIGLWLLAAWRWVKIKPQLDQLTQGV